jgi:hypothetical protein
MVLNVNAVMFRDDMPICLQHLDKFLLVNLNYDIKRDTHRRKNFQQKKEEVGKNWGSDPGALVTGRADAGTAVHLCSWCLDRVPHPNSHPPIPDAMSVAAQNSAHSGSELANIGILYRADTADQIVDHIADPHEDTKYTAKGIALWYEPVVLM